jgi:histidinol-phosphate aminotransferase
VEEMRWKEQLLTLSPYQPGKSIDSVKKQYSLSKIIKLASNENPYGCSPQVKPALMDQFENIAIYPDGNATNLREVLSAFLKVNLDEIIFGNGSDNLIQIISRALLNPNANTVMAAPTFSQYKHNAVIEGAIVKEVPLINGNHDLAGMLSSIDDQTTIVWLCSPNNPTGTYISERALVGFLEKVPPQILVVLDEAYFEYVIADDYYDSIKLTREYPNLIVLRTFSKIYGLASLRIGYGVAQPAVIKALEPAREPFDVNSYGQAAAAASLKDRAFVKECSEKNRHGLQQFYDFCEEHQLKYYPSQTNFILIDFNTDGDQVFQYLLERGYIVRSGKTLGFPTSVRITVGTPEENEGLFKVLKEYLANR